MNVGLLKAVWEIYVASPTPAVARSAALLANPASMASVAQPLNHVG